MKNAINSLKAAAYGAVSAALVLPSIAGAATSGGWQVSTYGYYGLPSGSLSDIIGNLVMWLLWIFGAVGIIGFVISGILYLTAGGNAEQEKSAKKAMTMSIIGVIVGLAGYVALQAVDQFLGGANNL